MPLARRTHRAGGEQPPDDGPAREDVGAEHLVGGVDHAADVAYEVAAQGLAVRGGQILPLKPVLVPLLLAEPHLEGKGEPRFLLRARGKLRKKTPERPPGSSALLQAASFGRLPFTPCFPTSPTLAESWRKQRGHCAARLQPSGRDHTPRAQHAAQPGEGGAALPGVRAQIRVNPRAVAAQLLASLEQRCCCQSPDNPPHRSHSEKALALESGQPGAMFPCKAVLCLLMNSRDVSGPATSAPAGQPFLLSLPLDARS